VTNDGLVKGLSGRYAVPGASCRALEANDDNDLLQALGPEE
jgi:hypothetical protein